MLRRAGVRSAGHGGPAPVRGGVSRQRGGEGGITHGKLIEGGTPGARFGSTLALLDLERDGGEHDLVVGAEGAAADRAVLVRGDGFEPLAGLGEAMQDGDPDQLRLGRTAGGS